MLILEFTDEERKGMMAVLDVALKAGGMQTLNTVSYFVNKFNPKPVKLPKDLKIVDDKKGKNGKGKKKK